MGKWYSKETFNIQTSNGIYSFECHTTDTRNGFCHTVFNVRTGENTKVSYINRTWESYTYQTALLKAFDKLPKAIRLECREWDDNKVHKTHEECEAWTARMKAAYDGLTDGQKERLAQSDITITSKEQADTALLGMEMMSAINKMLG